MWCYFVVDYVGLFCLGLVVFGLGVGIAMFVWLIAYVRFVCYGVFCVGIIAFICVVYCCVFVFAFICLLF